MMGNTTLEKAHVAITLAEFVNIDSDGRVTLVGAGNRILAVEPRTWRSPPFAVWAAISLQGIVSQTAIVELVLTGQTGGSIRIPDGAGGTTDVRLTHPVLFRPHQYPGLNVPPGELPMTYDVVATFASGLALEPQRTYRWQIEIDGLAVGTGYPFFVTFSDNAEIE